MSLNSTFQDKRYTILSVVILIALWHLLSTWIDNPLKMPTPMETLESLIQIVTGRYFMMQISNTLSRVLIGFAISFIMGTVLGMLSGFFKPLYYLLHPIVLIQRAMPTMGVILLALIWLNREVAPILVGFLIIFPIIYTTVVESIRSIDHNLMEMAKIYQFSLKKRILHLYLPSIKSFLGSVSATAIGLNIKVGIAAEVLSQPQYAIGTGFQMEKVALNTSGVIAWSIIAIFIAFLFEAAIKCLFTVGLSNIGGAR